MNDTQKLLDSTFPFIENLLKKNGEFFPVASAVNNNDEVAQVGTYDGDERPLSDKVITDLKEAFRTKKDNYKTIAIFYDVKVVDPKTNLKTDAVAVFAEIKNENAAYIIYYPYRLTSDKELIFSDAWKELDENQIFI